MKIAVKEILARHFLETSEYITQAQLAREMVKAGIFKNLHSAQNMLQYNIKGTAKSLDKDMINFLMERFDLELNEVIKL